MAAFTARNWYPLALALISVAIALQLLAKRSAGLGMMTMARSAECVALGKRYSESGAESLASAEAAKSERLHQVARRYARSADLWEGASLGLALLTAAYCAVAHFAGRGVTEKALPVLVAVYVLLLMLQV